MCRRHLLEKDILGTLPKSSQLICLSGTDLELFLNSCLVAVLCFYANLCARNRIILPADHPSTVGGWFGQMVTSQQGIRDTQKNTFPHRGVPFL